MFNNLALDVFIGLVFIFLLYSLLATAFQEMLARVFRLRTHMLVKAIRTMLQDRYLGNEWYGRRVWKSFWANIRYRLEPLDNNSFTEAFYKHPTIKYLAQSDNHSKPNYIGPENFANTIIRLLRGDEYDGVSDQMVEIRRSIETGFFRSVNSEQTTIFGENVRRYRSFRMGSFYIKILNRKNTPQELEKIVSKESQVRIDPETQRHLKQILADAQGDISRFKSLLEHWFNTTMDRTNGWYTRQSQYMLFLIGILIAFSFNVDCIAIYRILANDKTARDKLVEMAIRSKDNYSNLQDSLSRRRTRISYTIKSPGTGADTVITRDSVYVAASDSFVNAAYAKLTKDAAEASSILGLGQYQDSCCFCRRLDADYKKKNSAWHTKNKELENLRNKIQVFNATLIDYEPDAVLTQDSVKKAKEINLTQYYIDSINRNKLRRDYILRDSLSRVFAAFVASGRASPDTAFRKAYLHNKEACAKRLEEWHWIRLEHLLPKTPKQNGGLETLLGYFITALAISLGAQFWFDLLSKLISIRSAGRKPATSEDESMNTSDKSLVQLKDIKG